MVLTIETYLVKDCSGWLHFLTKDILEISLYAVITLHIK